MKTVCFTLDDNIRFLEELTRQDCRRLDEHPYIALLQHLHEEYGAKFQLNMFFSYAKGGFSLADVPERFREEFENKSGWLKLSFHSAYNEPAFPYDGADAQTVLNDFDAVCRQLSRVAGPKSLGRTTTLHYVCATQETMRALRGRGMLGFVAMAYETSGRESLRYHLSDEQARTLRKNDWIYDAQTDLSFIRNQLIIDRVSLEQLPDGMSALLNKPILQLMTHEQYFYSDYERFQPDFAQKLTYCWQTLAREGYRAAFVEELLQNRV